MKEKPLFTEGNSERMVVAILSQPYLSRIGVITEKHPSLKRMWLVRVDTKHDGERRKDVIQPVREIAMMPLFRLAKSDFQRPLEEIRQKHAERIEKELFGYLKIGRWTIRKLLRRIKELKEK